MNPVSGRSLRIGVRPTPLLFTITSGWSALGGSIVLWTLILAGYTAVVCRGVRGTQDRLGTGALGIMGIVGAFFFGLVATATLHARPGSPHPGLAWGSGDRVAIGTPV